MLVSVFDYDVASRDDRIGSGRVVLEPLARERYLMCSALLDDTQRPSGEVFFSIWWESGEGAVASAGAGAGAHVDSGQLVAAMWEGANRFFSAVTSGAAKFLAESALPPEDEGETHCEPCICAYVHVHVNVHGRDAL